MSKTQISSVVLAVLVIVALAGSLFGPTVVSAQRGNGNPPFAPPVSAFNVQAAESIGVDNITEDPITGARVEVFHTRTQLTVTDPTTGGPIENLTFPGNFTIEQFGALQDCTVGNPPPLFSNLNAVPNDLTVSVEELGNGFYTVDVAPDPNCVANTVVGLQITVDAAGREGRVAAQGSTFGPFCLTGNDCTFPGG